jgi:hypothetical protein
MLPTVSPRFAFALMSLPDDGCIAQRTRTNGQMVYEITKWIGMAKRCSYRGRRANLKAMREYLKYFTRQSDCGPTAVPGMAVDRR